MMLPQPEWLKNSMAQNPAIRREQITILSNMPGNRRFSSGMYTGKGPDGRTQMLNPTNLIMARGQKSTAHENEFITRDGQIRTSSEVSSAGGPERMAEQEQQRLIELERRRSNIPKYYVGLADTADPTLKQQLMSGAISTKQAMMAGTGQIAPTFTQQTPAPLAAGKTAQLELGTQGTISTPPAMPSPLAAGKQSQLDLGKQGTITTPPPLAPLAAGKVAQLELGKQGTISTPPAPLAAGKTAQLALGAQGTITTPQLPDPVAAKRAAMAASNAGTGTEYAAGSQYLGLQPQAATALADRIQPQTPVSFYDRTVADMTQQMREFATGTSDVYQRMANNAFNQLDPRLQTQMMITAMQIANNPNLTDGAKRTMMAETMRNMGIQQSELAANLANKAIDMAFQATSKAADMAYRQQTFEFTRQQYGDQEAQRMYADASIGMTWESFHEKYPTATQADFTAMSLKANKADTMDDWDIMSGRLDSAMERGSSTGDWSEAQSLWAQLAADPRFATYMGTQPNWDSLKTTYNRGRLDDITKGIGAQFDLYDNKPPMEYVEKDIRDYISILKGIPPEEVTSQDIEAEYNRLSTMPRTDKEKAIAYLSETYSTYFDTDAEKGVVDEAMGDILTHALTMGADGTFTIDRDSVYLPWNNPKYAHVFSQAFSLDPKDFVGIDLENNKAVANEIYRRKTLSAARESYADSHVDDDGKFTGLGLNEWTRAYNGFTRAEAGSFTNNAANTALADGDFDGWYNNLTADEKKTFAAPSNIVAEPTVTTSSGNEEIVVDDPSGLFPNVSGTTGLPVYENPANNEYEELTYDIFRQQNSGNLSTMGADKILYYAGKGESAALSDMTTLFAAGNSTVVAAVSKAGVGSDLYKKVVSALPTNPDFNTLTPEKYFVRNGEIYQFLGVENRSTKSVLWSRLKNFAQMVGNAKIINLTTRKIEKIPFQGT